MRKSMDLATMMAATNLDVTTTTPLLFNLVDLIVACLRSHSQQTITSRCSLYRRSLGGITGTRS